MLQQKYKFLLIFLLSISLTGCLLFSPPASGKMKFGGGGDIISSKSDLAKAVKKKSKGKFGASGSATIAFYYDGDNSTPGTLKNKINYFVTGTWNKGWNIKVQNINNKMNLTLLIDPLTPEDAEITFYNQSGKKLSIIADKIPKETTNKAPRAIIKDGAMVMDMDSQKMEKLKKIFVLVTYKQNNTSYYVAAPTTYIDWSNAQTT